MNFKLKAEGSYLTRSGMPVELYLFTDGWWFGTYWVRAERLDGRWDAVGKNDASSYLDIVEQL